MTETRDDYARTDQVDDALIPLEVIREKMQISHVTLWRKLKHANIQSVPYKGGKAVKWSDIVKVFNFGGGG